MNRELGRLDRFLEIFPQLLLPAGRVVILAYHSLEDRRVKQSFRRWSQTNLISIMTKKPVRTGEEEARTNPRARSAKLRIAERKFAA